MRLPRIRRRWVLPGVLAALLVLVIGAGAGAAFEADTVSNYWQGLWWALSLMTTVGFINGPPRPALSPAPAPLSACRPAACRPCGR